MAGTDEAMMGNSWLGWVGTTGVGIGKPKYIIKFPGSRKLAKETPRRRGKYFGFMRG